MSTHQSPTPRPRLRAGSAALALALAAALAPAQEALDTVLKTDGSSMRGVKVQTFTLSAVKVLRGTEEVDIPPHLVAGIRWGGAPDAFVGAEAALERGEFATAQQLYGEAANGTERELLKAEARFLQGKAAVGAGAADPAAAANAAGALRAWISEFPEHWHLPEAMYLLGRALRLGQVQADAETTLKELDDRSVRDGWGAVWSARAKYELALCLLDQGKTLEARGAFQSAASAADTALAQAGGKGPEFEAIKINSKVGEGETLVREKEFQRAADYFRSLSQNPDPSLAASGKAGQGEATFLAAADSKNPAKLREAQIALAEACVLDTGAGDTSAKANYYLGRVMRALGEGSGGDAKAYFQIVTRSYPTSRWAAAARAELAK
ncbi:MAG: tol-pal system YbgF family protein [Planctomycetota bacterium]